MKGQIRDALKEFLYPVLLEAIIAGLEKLLDDLRKEI